jgi:sugar phosphate isomerase/epimerase
MTMPTMLTTRRTFCSALAAAPLVPRTPAFTLRSILGSCMYGRMKLSEILPEVRAAGADAMDIWPERHGNQREQMEAMGLDSFAALLDRHNVRLGILTHYDLGPFRLQSEMRVARRFGCKLIICGASGPAGLAGGALKQAVRTFLEQMKPHLAAAAETDVVIGIENHSNSLIQSPDSLRYLAELAPSNRIGIALAPYHLPQDAKLVAQLIQDLGPRLVHFYAWQHGDGCDRKLPKERELTQLPGRGPLDFTPIVHALRAINYRGWTEVFMHPVPRGIPILPTAGAVTAEINRARRYLEACLSKESADG